MKRQLSIHLLMLATLFASSSDLFAKRSKKRECKSRFEEYDYVIVGGGTAGSVLAAKLSDPDKRGRFKNSVCVLEAGENLTEFVEQQNNIFAASINLGSPVFANFTQAFGFAGLPFSQPEGIMWGGSSGHNGLQWYRATPDIYNQWAAISGDDRWLYENLLNNVMIPIEHYTPDGTFANPDVHGFEGPIFYTQSPSVEGDPASQAIASGTGAGFVDDINDPSEGLVGVSPNTVSATPPLTSPDSVKSFGANSFLLGIESQGVPAIVDADGNGLNGRKLKIISNAWGNRVIFSKKRRAKGVEYTIGDAHGDTLVVRARKGVIISCGAIYTPALLQRSGIGNAELLESLDIPVVADSKQCGQNLANHVGGLGFIDVNSFVFPPYIGNAFAGFPEAPEERVYQLIYGAGPVLAFFAPQCVRTFVDLPQGGAGILALDVVPQSRGFVEIVNSDPFRQPIVNYNNYSDGGPSDPGSDANKIVRFYTDLLPAIAAAGGGNVIYPTPAQYAGGDDALFNAALITSIYTFHQSGTCSMGTSIENGVVDGKLKVFGVDGLYVADTSAAPVIQNCNTQTQAFYIGFELARILRGEG